jgi:hypothetical protein
VTARRAPEAVRPTGLRQMCGMARSSGKRRCNSMSDQKKSDIKGALRRMFAICSSTRRPITFSYARIERDKPLSVLD